MDYHQEWLWLGEQKTVVSFPVIVEYQMLRIWIFKKGTDFPLKAELPVVGCLRGSVG